ANGGSWRPLPASWFDWAAPGSNGGVPSTVEAAGQWFDDNGKWPDNSLCDGILCAAKGTRLAEISDGTSHTYLLVEKFLQSNHYETGLDLGDNESLFTGYDWDNVRSAADGLPRQDQQGI